MSTRGQQLGYLDLSKSVVRQVQDVHAKDLTLKSAFAGAGFVCVEDGIPGAVACSLLPQRAWRNLARVIWLWISQSLPKLMGGFCHVKTSTPDLFDLVEAEWRWSM